MDTEHQVHLGKLEQKQYFDLVAITIIKSFKEN